MVDEQYEDIPKNLSISDQNIIIIGSNKIDNQNYSTFGNFHGCISSELNFSLVNNNDFNFLDMNIILNDIKIDPFESAFGIRSGLDDVKVNGQIHQSICNSFKIQQKINIPLLPNEQTLTLLVIELSCISGNFSIFFI